MVVFEARVANGGVRIPYSEELGMPVETSLEGWCGLIVFGSRFQT